MSMLEDLANAIEAYPHEFINLEIVGVDPPGNTLDEDEDVEFDIHITNTGPLDVLELSLLVEGLNGTEVKGNGAAAQWTNAFTYSGTLPLDRIPGHSGDTPVVLSRLHFKHPRSRSTATDLVRGLGQWIRRRHRAHARRTQPRRRVGAGHLSLDGVTGLSERSRLHHARWVAARSAMSDMILASWKFFGV